MKDFNIENIERKNCYKIPEDFFAQMQKNVLERVGEPSQEVKKKAFSLNWWYAVAACTVVLFGLVLLFNSSNLNTNNQINLADKESKQIQKDNLIEPTQAQENFYAFANDVDNVIETQKLESSVPSVVKSENKVTKVPSKDITFSEEEIENFIESMPQDEISMITQNNIQDIYLDLYY